jgi:crotonobetainyl-CoA:carnitine CoA-transferase CaiB-like acyl-CoA transferase
MTGGVRYQIYESSDGHVLFMASEQAFWKNFCEGVGRPDLFEAHPGSKYADHARGNLPLRAELRDIFKSRSTQEWIAFGIEVNTPIAPVHTTQSIAEDPQFKDRLPWIPKEQVGCEQLPIPIKFADVGLPTPTMAPTLGQHTDAVLAEVCGYDDATLAQKRAEGAFGS